MTSVDPQLVPTSDLPEYFKAHSIAYQCLGNLKLGFGQGQDQYRLFPYEGPADDETMGIFFEWHTEDYFDVDTSPHIAIGLRGPLVDDPHRGRGLAIGILAAYMDDPENSGQSIELFKGCPSPPGGPSFFIEDFSINEGTAPISEWQFSIGQDIPGLIGNRRYRIDVHVSKGQVWAGIWMVSKATTSSGQSQPEYRFLGQTCGSDDVPAFSGDLDAPCPEDVLDRGQGNAFIGSGFSDPDSRSWIENIYIAHWKT
jgi:hypothetical protein